MITLSHSRLQASIREIGAELASLRDASGREFMWQAGPAWPRHAPVLFPIVGQLNHDEYRLDGTAYHLARHGFARDAVFDPAITEDDRALLVLTADGQTRALYPFAFRLSLDYRLTGRSLRVSYRVENPGSVDLPFSVGAHPAFNWTPPKEGQILLFDQPEPAPVRRLQGGLLDPAEFPTPIEGRELRLSEDLFINDALILDQVRSRAVEFGGLTVSWSDGFSWLGLWNKPGADFLCIEPWAGHADPVGFAGDFRQKPGITLLPPGDAAEFWWEVQLPEVGPE